MLDLTRIANGKLSLEMRSVDAHAVLCDAITAIRLEAAKKKIQLNLKLKAKPHQVRGDAVRLQQVFWNVLKNAVKFTPKGGKITVETFLTDGGDHLNLKMTDNGIGMTGEELSRVFKAFSQGDHVTTSSHRFGGLGLGLAISRQIVELHLVVFTPLLKATAPASPLNWRWQERRLKIYLQQRPRPRIHRPNQKPKAPEQGSCWWKIMNRHAMHSRFCCFAAAIKSLPPLPLLRRAKIAGHVTN